MPIKSKRKFIADGHYTERECATELFFSELARIKMVFLATMASHRCPFVLGVFVFLWFTFAVESFVRSAPLAPSSSHSVFQGRRIGMLGRGGLYALMIGGVSKVAK